MFYMILKRKLKFGLLLAWVALLFVACEYDEKTMDYHIQNHAEKHFKVSKVHFKQLQNNKKLMDRLGKLKNTTQQTVARIIQSNDNSFYIDTDVAYLIESENGKHSYTFQIIRQNPQYRLENLIIKKNNADGYNLYIAQYDITELEYQQLQNGENPSLINKLNIVPVANNIINTNNILNRRSAEGMCLTETIIPATSCSCEGHTITDLQNGESCTCSDSETIFPEQTIYSWEPCGNEGGGGGGDPIDDGSYDGPGGGYPGGSGGGTPPNGDSGTGNPTNPPDNTDPNPDNSFEDTQDPVNTTPVVKPVTRNNPCAKIKNLTNQGNFKTKFKALNTPQHLNNNEESGFQQVGDVFVDATPSGNDGVQYSENAKNGTHVHNNNVIIESDGTTFDLSVKMFSLKDLTLLIFGFRENNTDPRDAYHIMISNEGIFAITILDSDPFQFTNEQKNFLRNWKNQYKEDTQEIIRNYSTPHSRKTALQKMFLKGLKEAGLENRIGFFEGEIENENGTIDDYNIKWTRKELNNNTLNNSPCD